MNIMTIPFLTADNQIVLDNFDDTKFQDLARVQVSAMTQFKIELN